MEFVLTVFFSVLGGYIIYWGFHRKYFWWPIDRDFFTKYLGYPDYESMQSSAQIKFIIGLSLFSLLTITCLAGSYAWEITTVVISSQVGHILGYLQFLRIPRKNWVKSSLPSKRT